VNRQNLKKAIDTRLSGLCATPESRELIYRHMRGEKVMKRKMALGLILAIVLVVLMAGAAIALGGNLFSVFSKNDASLQYVADNAQTIEPKETPGTDAAEQSPVVMDSTYFDGSSLYLSYRIKGGATKIVTYTPTTEDLQAMQPVDSMYAPLLTEESAVLTAFIQNYQAGIAGGYHSRTIGRSDHIVTADGIDVPWESDRTETQGDDLICYIKFTSPLPDDIAKADAFTLQLTFYPSDIYMWFDGQKLFSRSTNEKEYAVLADIVRSSMDAQKRMSGQGNVSGQYIDVTAMVSPVSIVLTYPKTEGLEFALYDPATGEEATCISVEPQTDGTVLQTFEGLGRMPEALSACPIQYIYPDPKNTETQDTIYLKDQAIKLVP
jgi:hypothetical protein